MITVPLETPSTRDLLVRAPEIFPDPETSGALAEQKCTEEHRADLLASYRRNGRDVALVPSCSLLEAGMSLLQSDIWNNTDNLVVNRGGKGMTPQEIVRDMFAPYKPDQDERLGEMLGAAHYQVMV